MKRFFRVMSAFLLIFLSTTGIASAGLSFRFFLPPVVIGPPAVAASPPAYYSYPYGYYS